MHSDTPIPVCMTDFIDQSLLINGLSEIVLVTSSQSPGLRHSLVHEEEDSFFRGQLNSFPNDPHELSHRDVRGH